jgi:hypothetical protein
VKQVRFEIIVGLTDQPDKAEVQIGCDTLPPPLDALMVATEHMMNAMALQSNSGYEEALQLLVEGAKSSRVMMSHGLKVQ